VLTVLERFGIFARAPDSRPRTAIAAEIDAELAFHLEQSARELEVSGFAPDAARAEARRRFGDMERVRRECARTQLGERFMVQRLHFLLTGLLIAIVGFLWIGTRRAQAEIEAHRSANQELMHRLAAEAEKLPAVAILPPSAADDADRAALEQKMRGFLALPAGARNGGYKGPDGLAMDLAPAADAWRAIYQKSETWRHGLRITEQLAALPDAQGVEILAVIWPSLPVAHREQAFKPFVFHGGHPFALEALDLGVRDDVVSVRERALGYLMTYAWRDLAAGDGAAGEWMAEWREKPLADVVGANALRWARELGDLVASYDNVPADLMERQLAIVDKVRIETLVTLGVDLARILREAGVCERLPKVVGLCDAVTRSRAEKVVAWCTPR
jgi:hypothetical protein